MDIQIVNTILKLCDEQQTCSFEMTFLYDYFSRRNLCQNSKFILATVNSYSEIFKINRDQTQVELYMPFEICRSSCLKHGDYENNKNLCSNLHVCYDYFFTNICHRTKSCVYPHVLNEIYDANNLQYLTSLDLDLLSKAFRVYCQSKQHLTNYDPPKEYRTKPKSPINSSQMSTTINLSGNVSWKLAAQQSKTNEISPKPISIRSTSEKGVQIYWKPVDDIQNHFIEVVFSNKMKSNGDKIRTNKIYQHLGLALVFYENPDVADKVVAYGPVKFQSFTFISGLFHQTADLRHVCFSNLPNDTDAVISYIDMVSMPYAKAKIEFYENDKETAIVEYKEDIDISLILSNVRKNPEYCGVMIKCVQLHNPQTLFIEHDFNCTESDIIKCFDEKTIFHIKTYRYCSFVHFYSHDDLVQSMNRKIDDRFRIKPIYIDAYSKNHLNIYNEQCEVRVRTQTVELPLFDKLETKQVIPSPIDDNISSISQSTTPILQPRPNEKKTEISIEDNRSDDLSNNNDIHSELDEEDDDFKSVSSDFDHDDLLPFGAVDENGNIDFVRRAGENLKEVITEMEEAKLLGYAESPCTFLYGDDYSVIFKNSRFALGFIQYAEFHVEKQRNPEKSHLLQNLKFLNEEKLQPATTEKPKIEQSAASTATQTKKKKRNQRHKKKN